MGKIAHKFKMPSRPFIPVECDCGRSLLGATTWDEWDTVADKHTRYKGDNVNPDRTDFKVDVIGSTDDGNLVTTEWCRVHGRTTFTVRIQRDRRTRRCRACDQDRHRAWKARKK
jgi:hypothetical protein